jgi:uncharacterized membrane protein YdjX (TVP38/TMEM64 family)
VRLTWLGELSITQRAALHRGFGAGLTKSRRHPQADPMSSEEVVAKKKLPVLKILVVLVVLGVGGAFLLRGVNVRDLIEHAMTIIRDAGPVAYFTAMALLPAIGVPATVFTLTAGPVFGPKLGMPLVVFLSVAAIMFNIVLTYFLARRALRPVMEKLMTRFGYKLPQVAPEDTMDLAIIVRVTPGSPFPVQNYLLGLANVPFRQYLLVSFIVQVIYTPAFVLFGDALLHGKGKLAMVAVGLLAAAAVATHWARKHFAKKKAP